MTMTADPGILLHLASNSSEQHEVRSQLVISDGFQPTEAVYPYFNITKFWRKALKAELQRLNNHSLDLREHAWALASVHSVAQGKIADAGVVLVLEWQAESLERTERQNSIPMPMTPLLHSVRASPRQWVPSRNVIGKLH